MLKINSFLNHFHLVPLIPKALKHNQAVTQNNIPTQITFQQPISRREAKNQYGHNEKEAQHFENPCTHASNKLIYSK